MARSLSAAFDDIRDRAAREARRQRGDISGDMALWEAVNRQLRRAILPHLEEGIWLGVEIGAATLPIGFDWSVINERAMRWAREYSGRLIQRIDETTRRNVREIVANWIEAGEPLDTLNRNLERIFNRNRAEMIASTEVTAAFAEGIASAGAASGLDVIPPREKPPKHPRCRCWMTLEPRDDGKWAYIWQTANDELVCPECGPLHGMELV